VLIVGELPHSQRVELADRGAELTICAGPERAMETLAEQEFDVVVADLASCPGALRLVSLVKGGAGEFLRVGLKGKRWRESAEFAELLRLSMKELDLDRPSAPVTAQPRAPFDGLIGSGAVMREVFTAALRVAATDAALVIAGASGTGHKALARAIHRESARCAERCEVVDCAALSATDPEFDLLEAFDMAERGTLVLDHIEGLPPALQQKVLQVLDTRKTGALGGIPSDVNVRVLATTSIDLWQSVQAKTFSEELYFRLSVFTVVLPPLSERREDIAPIAKQVVILATAVSGTPEIDLGDEIARLVHNEWPGNVRQLVDTIRTLVSTAHGGVLQLNGLTLSSEHRPPSNVVELEDALFRAFHARNLHWNVPRETIERAAARHAMTPFVIAPPDPGTQYAIIITAPEIAFMKLPEQLPLTSAVMSIDAATYLGTAKPMA
jgi:DNA-binding NtrC family response regulator